jgi:hypothetical protein
MTMAMEIREDGPCSACAIARRGNTIAWLLEIAMEAIDGDLNHTLGWEDGFSRDRLGVKDIGSTTA